jgi:hypothetical protein
MVSKWPCPQKGSGLTFRVAETDSKGNSLRLALTNIRGSIPNPAAVGANVGGQLHLRNNWSGRSVAVQQGR